MHLNDAGHTIERHWLVLPSKFPRITLDAYTIMPNHVHGVILLGDASPDQTSLGTVIQWFKTMTTNAYIRGCQASGWPLFDRRLWQRNYWEHIIRDGDELTTIRTYIDANAAQWADDRLHPESRSPFLPGGTRS